MRATRAAAGSVTAPHVPTAFRRAVASLAALQVRPEIALAEIPPPQRLAPWSHALGADVVRAADPDDLVVASGRLVLLHDPAGQDAWNGTLRLVAYVRAELEAELAGDPLLPDVGWSWLTEALEFGGADCTALGGTVTRTSSARFGDIAGPVHSHDLELRASWTPLGDDLAVHGAAFCALLAAAAGLAPVGVPTLGG